MLIGPGFRLRMPHPLLNDVRENAQPTIGSLGPQRAVDLHLRILRGDDRTFKESKLVLGLRLLGHVRRPIFSPPHNSPQAKLSTPYPAFSNKQNRN